MKPTDPVNDLLTKVERRKAKSKQSGAYAKFSPEIADAINNVKLEGSSFSETAQACVMLGLPIFREQVAAARKKADSGSST